MSQLPRSPSSTLVLRHNQKTVHEFILLFMPPCGPHLTPLATGSVERSLLVLYTPRGLTGDDLLCLFFTCTNTSQAATCTCNITRRTQVSDPLGKGNGSTHLRQNYAQAKSTNHQKQRSENHKELPLNQCNSHGRMHARNILKQGSCNNSALTGQTGHHHWSDRCSTCAHDQHSCRSDR
jgi:hypothetical protein